MALYSKPGAKINPTKSGKFIMYGWVNQLAMFLHFKDLGPDWACPYNLGTKATKRIIGEM